ncbi:hypothetical protein [Acidiphilium angustum]|uniref:hypothetical protein n=1 Tax=Acidiphilium angustum TaxID=523 RepID=UPI0005567F72|nr:hypothetical protein [Acidiphilium angustum]
MPQANDNVLTREVSVPTEIAVTMHVEKIGTKLRARYEGIGSEFAERVLAAHLFNMGIEMLMQNIDMATPEAANE